MTSRASCLESAPADVSHFRTLGMDYWKCRQSRTSNSSQAIYEGWSA